MNKIQLQEELSALETDYKAAVRAVARKFAIVNNPYKVDDVISDQTKTIKIKQIKYDVNMFSGGLPQCVYVGDILKKDGTPSTKYGEGQIYQSNVKTA